MADDFDLVKISQLPAATSPGEYDVLAGVQSGDTKQFSFSVLLAWMQQAITATAIGAVPVTRKVNNKALSTDITLTASDVGAQPKVNVSGILKGDGSGGISAAVAGTDYQTPLEAGTDYATPAMIPSVPDPSDATPQALGTAAAGSSGDYSRSDHVHGMPSASDVGALAADGTAVAASTLAAQYSSGGVAEGWYKFLTLTILASQSRNAVLLISDSYTAPVGILAIRFNRTSSGAGQYTVRWLATTIAIDDVRYIYDSTAGTLTFYFRKRTNTNGHVAFRVLLATTRTGVSADLTGSWSFTAVEEPTTAEVASADINNNAATATNALNDGDGNSIAGTYARADEIGKVLGDPAGVNAAVGEYVSYNGGLYTVNTAITSDMAASVFASYLDAVPDGGLNALNNQTLDGVYSCYGYRADLISTVDVQLKKDYVTDGTTYRIFAPLYLIDFNNPQTVDEYYLMLDQNNPSRFVRVTGNNSNRNITATAFDPATGVLTLTLNGTRRYVGADVRIAKQLI